MNRNVFFCFPPFCYTSAIKLLYFCNNFLRNKRVHYTLYFKILFKLIEKSLFTIINATSNTQTTVRTLIDMLKLLLFCLFIEFNSGTIKIELDNTM